MLKIEGLNSRDMNKQYNKHSTLLVQKKQEWNLKINIEIS